VQHRQGIRVQGRTGLYPGSAQSNAQGILGAISKKSFAPIFEMTLEEIEVS
jgi:hypothetical protein